MHPRPQMARAHLKRKKIFGRCTSHTAGLRLEDGGLAPETHEAAAVPVGDKGRPRLRLDQVVVPHALDVADEHLRVLGALAGRVRV